MTDSEMQEALGRELKKLVPKGLDDVIRKNREYAELGLATDEEIQAITGEIVYAESEKGIIDDWRMISLREKKSGTVQVILLGRNRAEGAPWATSSLVVFDRENKRVVTKSNSLYKLGKRGIGEPPNIHLVHLCATLHYWGSGAILGVPPFFF